MEVGQSLGLSVTAWPMRGCPPEAGRNRSNNSGERQAGGTIAW
jgi:hypothetical protein